MRAREEGMCLSMLRRAYRWLNPRRQRSMRTMVRRYRVRLGLRMHFMRASFALSRFRRRRGKYLLRALAQTERNGGDGYAFNLLSLPER